MRVHSERLLMRATMAARPTIAIIVLNYCRVQTTIACVTSLLPSLKKHSELALMLVDNASPDGSGQELEQWLSQQDPEVTPRLRFFQSATNGGYGPGNNQGWDAARTAFDPEWYWILNNDTVVPPESVGRLLAHLASVGSADLLGMRVHTPGTAPTSDIFGGGWLLRSQGRTKMARTANPRRPLDFLSGSSFAIRAKLIERIGLFPDDHFLFWEELDLFWRARAQEAQLRVLYDVVVDHSGGATSGASPHNKSSSAHYYATRAACVYYRRRERLLPTVWLVTCRLVYAAKTALFGNPRAAAGALSGLWHGLSQGIDAGA